MSDYKTNSSKGIEYRRGTKMPGTVDISRPWNRDVIMEDPMTTMVRRLTRIRAAAGMPICGHVECAEERAGPNSMWCATHKREAHWYNRGIRIGGGRFNHGHFNQMWLEQDGKCSICDKKLEFQAYGYAVDHAHTERRESAGNHNVWIGEVRSILCDVCNRVTGLIETSPRIHAIMLYLYIHHIDLDICEYDITITREPKVVCTFDTAPYGGDDVDYSIRYRAAAGQRGAININKTKNQRMILENPTLAMVQQLKSIKTNKSLCGRPMCIKERASGNYCTEHRMEATWYKNGVRKGDGIFTYSDFLELWNKNDSKCQVCLTELAMNGTGAYAVDHSHDVLYVGPKGGSTWIGEVRGLLCQPCNRIAGELENSPLYRDVMSYLMDYNVRVKIDNNTTIKI